MASLAPPTDPRHEPAAKHFDGDGLFLGALVALVLAIAALVLGIIVVYATFVSLAA